MGVVVHSDAGVLTALRGVGKVKPVSTAFRFCVSDVGGSTAVMAGGTPAFPRFVFTSNVDIMREALTHGHWSFENCRVRTEAGLSPQTKHRRGN